MTEIKEEAGALPALPKRPDDRLTIQYGPEGQRSDKVLFFSFLRQNSLLRFMESPMDVINLKVNPDLNENVLKIMLAEKGGPGQMIAFELDETLISGEDVDLILDWIQEHMTYFFMKRFQDMAVKAKQLEPLAKGLQSSVTGSDPSTSSPQSAGPSA